MAQLTVAVTGAAGYVGTRLVRSLCADDRVGRVLGFDLRQPGFHSDKLVFDVLDIRDERLATRLRGADSLVHLAFVTDPIRDTSEMHDVNVGGSQNVFNCAAEASVSKIVYSSSATVYGAHPNNDCPLTEDSPLRANLDFSFAAHKLEVEYIVKEFRSERSDVVVTLYRPAVVFGPHVDNVWSRLMEYPVLFGIKGYAPPFQFVHEDDVASALLFAVFNDLDGDYNLAPRGWLEHDETSELIGRKSTKVSEQMAFPIMERLWRIGMAEAPAGMLNYVMHPWVMSADKLADTGFVCTKSNTDALTEALSCMRPFVRIGRARLRKTSLAMGTGVAAAGLGVAIAATRRRRGGLGRTAGHARGGLGRTAGHARGGLGRTA
ncbi:MAG: NAD-dependent epimerase/dehydratase family protein [Actinomycetota bacterium]|nr:NAD-dependent epimerase/dehydratase family protein [Actinomycetota bacterium]